MFPADKLNWQQTVEKKKEQGRMVILSASGFSIFCFQNIL